MAETVPQMATDSKQEKESKLRDLIRQLRAVAEAHFAYSQASSVLQNAFDHLAALARIEEVNRKGDL
jgi:hypothetical protein